MATIDTAQKQEIATIERDPLSVLFGGILTNQDDTMLSRGGGKGLKIYDDIERDCHAFAVLQKRKMAMVSREWQVDPASGSRQDKKAADLVRNQLANLGFDQLCVKMQDALLKGYSVGEILWGTDSSEIVAAQVKVKPQRRFVFGQDMLPRLLTIDNQVHGEPLPDRKFIVHRCGAKDDDNPYGLGLGHKLFWPVFFKRQDITFWLSFVDKFAAPTAMGEFPPGTVADDQQKLLDSLRSLSSEAGIIVPQGMMVKFLEAARSGSIDTYERLARYMDEQISEAVLGETLSTNIGQVGSQAAAQTHNEVRVELSKADSDLFSDTVNSSLVRWLVEYNLPGAGLPKVWRDFEDKEDIKYRSETDKNITDMGFEPDEQYINDTYGGKWRRKKQLSVASVQPDRKQPQPAAGEFAESRFTSDQQAVEDLADGAVDKAAELLAANEAKILAAVLASSSYEEAQQKIIELYPDLDMGGLEDLMARSWLAAELHGRSTVEDANG